MNGFLQDTNLQNFVNAKKGKGLPDVATDMNIVIRIYDFVDERECGLLHHSIGGGLELEDNGLETVAMASDLLQVLKSFYNQTEE